MKEDYKNPDTDRRDYADDETEIDLLELAYKLWDKRRMILRWCGWGALVGLIIAFSIPKEYSSTVKLAPEAVNGKSSGSLGALASMAGISTGTSSADAVYPDLYPDVVSSVPFVTSLFDVELPLNEEDSVKMTLQEYMTEEISSPWWSVIMGVPGRLIGLLKSNEDVDESHRLDPFRLTVKERNLVEAINARVGATVDSKTSVVTINVTMQDPLVSAVLADTVMSRLQEYVIDYRTNKARQDLEYITKLNQEAKDTYYKAQQNYADYLDRNQGISLYSAQTTRERMKNETDLAFSLYNPTSQPVQQAQAKVQENTPVFAIVTPATVPTRASKPRKALILVGFVFLAFVASSAWILFGEPMLESFRATRSAQAAGTAPADKPSAE